MTSAELWRALLVRAGTSGYEIHTRPRISIKPRWFWVSVVGDTLFIDNAQQHVPSVRLSRARRISFKDFDYVYGCYVRHKGNAAKAKREAVKKSRNTIYIVAMIEEANSHYRAVT
ncbi:hypothetical protein [Indiicoccus explosivorum]|uniref:hypothetical protein n=1 Tax=Indiicoccus explosivorum TaxID=1917864 RepID=UPI001186C598|nr:hypothetical protein [Indiicoccus explosivorum]